MAVDILHSVFVIIILIESNPDFEMRKKPSNPQGISSGEVWSEKKGDDKGEIKFLTLNGLMNFFSSIVFLLDDLIQSSF